MFNPIDPEVDKINIIDIAHSLSMQCRFTGHTKEFYSVAQHCINVVNLMKNDSQSKKLMLEGLLHDASEAYLTDIATPVKPHLVNYKEIEEKVQSLIYEKYGIIELSKHIVKQYDTICLNMEGYHLMPNKTEWAKPCYCYSINFCSDPIKTKLEFIELFYELGGR
jgi:hypothetical protein